MAKTRQKSTAAATSTTEPPAATTTEQPPADELQAAKDLIVKLTSRIEEHGERIEELEDQVEKLEGEIFEMNEAAEQDRVDAREADSFLRDQIESLAIDVNSSSAPQTGEQWKRCLEGMLRDYPWQNRTWNC